MKTAATPSRSWLFFAGAAVAVVAITWSASARQQASSDQAAPQLATQPTLPIATAPAAVAEVAQTPVTSVKRTETSAPAASPGEAGMRIFLDEETGQITSTPSPEQAASLAGSIESLPESLPERVNADGSVGVDLQGYFQEYAVVQLDANGHRVVECVPNPQEALRKGLRPAVEKEDR
jgi:hypothetical protein